MREVGASHTGLTTTVSKTVMASQDSNNKFASTQDVAADAVARVVAPLVARYGQTAVLAGAAAAIGRVALASFLGEGVAPAHNDNAGTGQGHADHGAHNHIIFYDGGCDGARRMAERLGRPVLKKGYVSLTTLECRMEDLGASRYGAARRCSKNPSEFIVEPGFGRWRLSANRPGDFANVVLPRGVWVENDVYHVDLPAHVDAAALDKRVCQGLSGLELGHFAHSAEGRALCAARGLDPDEFVRYTRDQTTGEYRRATELYVFHPRRHRPYFANILTTALASFADQAA